MCGVSMTTLGFVAVFGLVLVGQGSTAQKASERYQWRLQTTVPTIGGRLRTLAVDPARPRLHVAGTAEGTVLRSEDNGETWQEFALEPFVVLPRATDPPGLSDPRVTLPLPSGLRSLRSGEVERVTNPVRRVALCEGSGFNFFVASRSSLFGTLDRGVTYLRLLGAFEGSEISVVDCRATCPSYVAVATARGLFLSRDGGWTFSAGLTPVGKSVQAVEIDCREGRPPRLLFAQGRRLYSVDLAAETDARMIFPSPAMKGALSGPFTDILDIEVIDDRLWLATRAGLFRSDGRASDWVALGDAFLQRTVTQVVAASDDEESVEIVAVIDTAANRGDVAASIQSLVMLSEDGGRTWSTAFSALSQRRVRWVQPGHLSDQRRAWWIATSGGLWVGARGVGHRRRGAPHWEAEWAARRLESLPPLRLVIDRALAASRLTAKMVAQLSDRRRERCWAPKLNVGLIYSSSDQIRLDDRAGLLAVFLRRDDLAMPTTQFAAMLTWDSACLFGDGFTASSDRVDLAGLRQEISFAVQDAYRERVVLLRRLDAGVERRHVAETLRARIESLEAVIESFSGEPLANSSISPALPAAQVERNNE